MSFLEKFKGKTTLLKRAQVSEILGQKSQISFTKHNQNTQLHLLKLTSIPQQNILNSSPSPNIFKKTNSSNINSQKVKASNIQVKSKKDQDKNQLRKNIQNPFLVQNEFFLDEQQREAALRRRKEEQIQQRIQKERKKKLQLEQQMMKSMRNSPQKSQKYSKKQWVKLGGLGANIGGEEWTKKKTLQQKMLKFADEIKKINLSKVESALSKSLDLRRNKSVRQKNMSQQLDARTLGIKYSKSIQKPTFYSLQKTNYEKKQMKIYNPDFQSIGPQFYVRQQNRTHQSPMDPEENQFTNLKIERNYSDLQTLDSRHKAFKELLLAVKQ